MEITFMPLRPLLLGAAHFTTAIVRMFGKAVKLRHCPATVSALALRPVLSAMAGNQPRLFRLARKFLVNHCGHALSGRVRGKVAG
jgi:hypothetical protein